MELKKGTPLQRGKYTIEKKLGQGSFGITYLATAKFTTDSGLGKMDVVAKVCIKEFFMSDVNSRKEDGSTIEGSSGTIFTNYRRKFRKEAENLAKLSHSNIVRVFDVFDENNTSYYVMEFLDGKNLDDYIKLKGCLPEDEAIKIINNIGSALSYMHSKKMLHLDLKPKNVMLTSDGQVHLIDFGLSKQYKLNGEPETSTTIGLGTPGYAPLEQSQYKQDGSFHATLDVYALGATLFKMLTGKRPPEAPILLNEGFPYSELSDLGISAITAEAISKAMNSLKKDRFQTVAEFISALTIRNNMSNTIGSISETETNTNRNDSTIIYDKEEGNDVCEGEEIILKDWTFKDLWLSRPTYVNIIYLIAMSVYLLGLTFSVDIYPFRVEWCFVFIASLSGLSGIVGMLYSESRISIVAFAISLLTSLPTPTLTIEINIALLLMIGLTLLSKGDEMSVIELFKSKKINTYSCKDWPRLSLTVNIISLVFYISLFGFILLSGVLNLNDNQDWNDILDSSGWMLVLCELTIFIVLQLFIFSNRRAIVFISPFVIIIFQVLIDWTFGGYEGHEFLHYGFNIFMTALYILVCGSLILFKNKRNQSSWKLMY